MRTRFIEEVRGDEPELASHLRIEERELEAGGPELEGCCRYRAMRSDARSDRPDHERQDAGKEAEAEETVFAQARENRGERDEKPQPRR